MARVLGIDPGSRKTGWGLIEVKTGAKGSAQRVVCLDAGVVRLSPDRPLADRLEILYDELSGLVDEHAPHILALEDIFYAKHANAAIKLGHVRGVVLLLAAKRGLQLAEYPPALVKRTVTGRGAADKSQVTRLVASMLKLEALPSEDAADALAVAITHLSSLR